uniref:Uncharacterized protein n=1 Tax=Cacopsylla melanoneura TaxID=428564 RepID=A0A8D8LB37_9HEMI
MDSVMQIEYLLDSPASRYLTFLKHSEKRRKQWVRPYFKSRLNNGEFARCYKELRENATHFFEYTRMAPFTFDYILNHVRGNLHRVSNFRECISPEEKLFLKLFFC